jgi:hypothetical protein
MGLSLKITWTRVMVVTIMLLLVVGIVSLFMKDECLVPTVGTGLAAGMIAAAVIMIGGYGYSEYYKTKARAATNSVQQAVAAPIAAVQQAAAPLVAATPLAAGGLYGGSHDAPDYSYGGEEHEGMASANAMKDQAGSQASAAMSGVTEQASDAMAAADPLDAANKLMRGAAASGGGCLGGLDAFLGR